MPLHVQNYNIKVLFNKFNMQIAADIVVMHELFDTRRQIPLQLYNF
jgi:hypothetical protein